MATVRGKLTATNQPVFATLVGEDMMASLLLAMRSVCSIRGTRPTTLTAAVSTVDFTFTTSQWSFIAFASVACGH